MLEAGKTDSAPASAPGADSPNPNKALWEKGDFTRIAATMRESGEDLVLSLGIKPGMQVLDLGSGDGTTAIPAAWRGADVIGVDFASTLVHAGNNRALNRPTMDAVHKWKFEPVDDVLTVETEVVYKFDQ